MKASNVFVHIFNLIKTRKMKYTAQHLEFYDLK